jgi:POT family proton-dependent oligopeptide transporter
MGHPKGLFVLFFVELWERFSFYGMRALLVFYMTKQLLFTDSMSYGIYGAYGSLVYATPVIGGLLADRLLGYRRAIFLGAVLMALGHFAMTFDHETLSMVLGSMATETGTANQLEIALGGASWTLNTTIFFYGALALLIVGNGFFKPNISSLVGSLYDDDEMDESKRDGGFTIFYMGINIGALLAPLTCGYIGENFGWHYGFGLAGIGMVAGLLIFVFFEDVLGEHGYSPYPDKLEGEFPPNTEQSELFRWAGASLAIGLIAWFGGPAIGRAIETMLRGVMDASGTTEYMSSMFALLGFLGVELGILAAIFTLISNKHATYLGTLVAIPNIAYLVTRHDVMGGLLLLLGVGVLGSLFMHAIKSEKVVRERLFVVLVLIFFSMTFWAFFEQAGSSINLFTDRNVDRVVFGWEIPASIFQGVNPAFIILLGPIFSWMWEQLSKMEVEPSTPVKFGLGIIQLGLGFGVLFLGASFAGTDGMVALGFLLMVYMLHTTGELCLSPVGLSMVTKLSPKETVGVVMGAWFLSSSFAHYIAAIFASFASAPEGESMKQMAPTETLPIYADLFMTIGLIAGVVGLVCLMLSPILKKWMHGVS